MAQLRSSPSSSPSLHPGPEFPPQRPLWEKGHRCEVPCTVLRAAGVTDTSWLEPARLRAPSIQCPPGSTAPLQQDRSPCSQAQAFALGVPKSAASAMTRALSASTSHPTAVCRSVPQRAAAPQWWEPFASQAQTSHREGDSGSLLGGRGFSHGDGEFCGSTVHADHRGGSRERWDIG